jgi:hypothetical protein
LKGNTVTALIKKLHPKNFKGPSGKWVAILGCILDQVWTQPAIAELIVTVDGCLLARHEGDCGANDFLGTENQLRDNWTRYLDLANLTPSERAEAELLYQNNVRRA